MVKKYFPLMNIYDIKNDSIETSEYGKGHMTIEEAHNEGLSLHENIVRKGFMCVRYTYTGRIIELYVSDFKR